MKKDFLLETSDHKTIQVSCFYSDKAEISPCVFIIHGFKGFKDWGYVPFYAQELAELGFFVVTFNFSHNGIGNNPFEITELDKFANNTISLEVSELTELIKCYNRGEFGFEGKNNPIFLIGHSRGGAIAIITVADHKNLVEFQNVRAIILWGTISTFERYSPSQIEKWKSVGYLEVLNTRTNQILRINHTLIEDYERNKERFNLLRRIKEIELPILIVHGEQDLTVPVKEAYQLLENSNQKTTELVTVSGAGHTFNITHPYTGSTPQFDYVKKKTIEFIRKQLSSRQ